MVAGLRTHIMKPCGIHFVAASMAWFGATTALAQYGGNNTGLLGLPESHELQFRPFTFSFSTDSGYDSAANSRVFTSGNGNNGNNNNGKTQLQSSLYAGFNASGAVNFIGSDTFLGSRTTTGYTYYFNRRLQDRYRTQINIDSTFSHTFNPRWTLNVSDNFTMDDQAQIGTGSVLPNQSQQ